MFFLLFQNKTVITLIDMQRAINVSPARFTTDPEVYNDCTQDVMQLNNFYYK